MGTGKSELYSGTHGSSSDAMGTTKQQKEKNKKVAEKRKETIRKKLEAVRNCFLDGKISLIKIRQNPKQLKSVTPNQWIKVLKEYGYEDISKTKSKNPASKAQIVRIGKQGKGHNVNQIQFSPGGGRHGESPYIKISTTDNQGKIKVVFGKKADYKNEGNERATIIFTEE